MRHGQAVLEEVGDSADASLGGGAGEQLKLERNPSVPEFVAVGKAVLHGLVTLLPEVEGDIKSEGFATKLQLLEGPASVATGLAIGVEGPKVFAVGHPHLEAARLGRHGASKALDNIDAGLEIGRLPRLAVDKIDPVVLPHRTRHI